MSYLVNTVTGTAKEQLQNKDNVEWKAYVNGLSIAVAGGIIVLPICGWMQDVKGYGFTLCAINTLGVTAAIVEVCNDTITLGQPRGGGGGFPANATIANQ